MITTGWRVRTGHPDDRQLLASFQCADNAFMWQAEVERFIQSGLADWTFDPYAAGGDPRLLLAFAEGDLFGIAAHERATLRTADGSQFHATKLEVIAVALKWQGRTLSSGERASDVLMQAVMNDVRARVPPRDARIFAVVHEDNHRSIAVCRRHGITEEMSRPHPNYRRLVTPHKRAWAGSAT